MTTRDTLLEESRRRSAEARDIEIRSPRDTIASRVEEIGAAKESRKVDAISRYRDLVRRSCTGSDDLDPDIAAETLADVGKSIDEFESDCDTYEKRMQWRAVLDGSDAHDRRAAELQEEVSKIAAKRQRDYDAATAKINELAVARDAELTAVNGVNVARGHLLRTAWPQTLEAKKALEARLAACGIQQLEQHIGELEAVLRNDESQMNAKGRYTPTESNMQLLKRHHADVSGRLDEARGRLEDAKRRRDEILSELALVEKEMLEP